MNVCKKSVAAAIGVFVLCFTSPTESQTLGSRTQPGGSLIYAPAARSAYAPAGGINYAPATTYSYAYGYQYPVTRYTTPSRMPYNQRRVVPQTPRTTRYRAPVRYVRPRRIRLRAATPFGRYRAAVDRGADPNWAARRGLRLFKPWEY